MSFGYFYGDQSNMFIFYRTPKVFYTDEKYKKLSRDSRTLYGILLDRVSLSAKNGWFDEEGRVYILCTLKSIMEALSISDKTATKLFVELEEFGLIERERQGIGKPYIIYVKNFMDTENVRVDSRKNYESSVVKITSGQSENLRCNNTNINNTNINNTHSIPSERENERYKYISYFMESLGIKYLKVKFPYQRDLIDEILALIVDTVCSTRDTIRISGDDKPIGVVKGIFMKLDSSHIEFVLRGLDENTTKVINIRAYLLASIYNAPLTVNNYYKSLVNHDMATGV